MKFLSFARLFGRTRPPQRTARRAPRPARLALERLESRELLAVPRIIGVTPANLSSTTQTQPTISVQFSSNVKSAEAQDPANYLLFDSSGNAVPVQTVTYSNTGGSFVATLTSYNNGNPLPSDSYTLLVRGNQIHDAATNTPLAQNGQLVAANQGAANVSVLGVNDPPTNDGQIEAPTNYASGTQFFGFQP